MFRKRTSWCWNIRPEIPTPAVKHHTVMADGTYMSHDWCLIVAVDGETGEALGFQWCSHESKDVYGQINVYGVTTKSERHKRSYWTRTADGNGIGGRKAPVPYGS